jgi:hypothetical protein
MVVIVRCDISSHCEREVYLNMCLIVNVFRDKAVWVCKYIDIVNDNKKGEINLTFMGPCIVRIF